MASRCHSSAVARSEAPDRALVRERVLLLLACGSELALSAVSTRSARDALPHPALSHGVATAFARGMRRCSQKSPQCEARCQFGADCGQCSLGARRALGGGLCKPAGAGH